MGTKPINFKIAGGATAQILGLMSALKVRREYGRNFQIKYFPFSTGTYWPFEIDFLLEKNELSEVVGLTRGIDYSERFTRGKIIETHPLQRGQYSYEKLLMLIRKMHLEFPLRYFFQKELALESNPKRIHFAGSWVKNISGGYFPFIDTEVFGEMDRRFKYAGKKSPFSRDENSGDYICIHFRLGDKRTNFSTNFNDRDGVMDPKSFKKILEKVDPTSRRQIFVVSDEPELAQKMLKDVGISAQLLHGGGDIWVDLYGMSRSSILIGS